jgi:hypothetical protein
MSGDTRTFVARSSEQAAGEDAGRKRPEAAS